MMPLSAFFLYWLPLGLVYAGAFAITARLPDPASLKLPLMAAGMFLLVPWLSARLKASYFLIPFLFFWAYLYLNLARTAGHQSAALGLTAMFLAFMLGFARVPLAPARLVLPFVLLAAGRGVWDLVALTHLGGANEAAAISASAVTSFFADKHVYGGLLILGAFHHFQRMEYQAAHKPVQVFLYCSTLLVLLSILLVDSRVVQGAFFLAFLPLLIVSVRLDFGEPTLERLAWVSGITLCLGLAWVNLPERQLHDMAEIFQSVPGHLRWGWESAWALFRESGWSGAGTGGFRFAVIPHEQIAGTLPDSQVLPGLAHAGNHYLEVLAENGVTGLILEGTLLSGAWSGMGLAYHRLGGAKPRYAFFSLLALALMACFSPSLERTPLTLAYWALIGYGWSLLAEHAARPGTDPRQHPGPVAGAARLPRYAASGKAMGLLAALAAVLGCFHAAKRVQELRSDRLYARAMEKAGGNPEAFTNLLAESLRIHPRNEKANYKYVWVLSSFHREAEAIERLGYVQSFAPNRKIHWQALAEAYFSMEQYDSSAAYAARLSARYPRHLPTLEILMRSLTRRGRCAEADSLRASLGALESAYPLPATRLYTAGGMDSLFMANHEVNFLQRWFGGAALKKRFTDRRMETYNLRFANHVGLRALMDMGCADPDGPPGPPPAARPKRLFRGWG